MTRILAIDAPSATAARGFGREFPLGLAAAGAWGSASLSARILPDLGDWLETASFAWATGLAALAILALTLAGGLWPPGGRWIARASPWLIATGLFLALWELASAKLGWAPQPFFPPPQALLEVFVYEYADLWRHASASLKLAAVGFAFGAAAGFALGVAVGWSTHIGYWAHPLLRFVGPLPATALLPVAFVAFPTSWSASVFLIALSAGFPVAILTWSGVASVKRAYYDVARTQGMGVWGLIFKVAIPAAAPNVFVGLFMALGAAFSALMVAELVGVKAGIAFYIQWSQGWAAYAEVWTTLIVLALICSGSITLLFAIRDRVLSWRKGLVSW